jgi:cation:H+ antiporter
MIDSFSKIAVYLGWKEFVVAFFVVSLGSVAPELFIGIISSLNKVPELAFGNILGQNILLLSFTIGICAITLKSGIEAESRTVRAGTTFAVFSAILPLFLILDGELSRLDGLLLLSFFFIFIFWLFSKKERFTKVYEGVNKKNKKINLISFFKQLLIIFVGFLFIIMSAQGIVISSKNFSEIIGVSIPLIGILIVAIGVGLPETYFSFMLAKKGQSWMILGGLMGSVAISSTLVLGVVSLMSPIGIDTTETSSFFMARIFLIICSFLLLFFVRSGRKISVREGIILVSVYISFIILEILIQ